MGGRQGTSRIGLGGATFGREIDESAVHLVLDYAVRRGITFFDTALAYGDGVSESILGNWVASRRPSPTSVTLATKIAPPYQPARIAEVVDGCLRRLRVPAIDVLYLHWWDETAESPAALAALHALVRTGKVRRLGASNYNHLELATALRLQAEHGFEPFRVAQNNNNLAVTDLTPELRRLCAAQAIALVTYSPLGAGFLTGKHRHGVQPNSRFTFVPGLQSIYFNQAAEQRLDRLARIAERHQQSQTDLALAWALHQPDVEAVLIGARTTAHIDQALRVQALEATCLLREVDQYVLEEGD